MPVTATNCACTALRRASRAVTHLYDMVLAPCGLKATQLIILRGIEDNGEIPQWLLAEQYAVSKETLSRRLSAMRRAGLVKARIGPKRGERLYTLTGEGRKLLNEATPHWQSAQSRLQEALGGTYDLLEAIRTLDRLTRAAQRGAFLRRPNGPVKITQKTTAA